MRLNGTLSIKESLSHVQLTGPSKYGIIDTRKLFSLTVFLEFLIKYDKDDKKVGEELGKSLKSVKKINLHEIMILILNKFFLFYHSTIFFYKILRIVAGCFFTFSNFKF